MRYGFEGDDRDWTLPPRVLLAPSSFDAALCAAIRRAMHGGRPETADILEAGFSTNLRARRAECIEVGDAVLQSIEQRLDAMADRVATFFGARLETREGPGLLRYRQGGFYGVHRDHGTGSVWPGAARRRVSIVVFLNTEGAPAESGGFQGGLLRIVDAGEVVRPTAGLLVAFPATMRHEVTPVEHGVRDVVVDWWY
jgi:predicted 2-oxoglutarate/Fe(II)-dependent dioxygenase YbiX